MQILPAFLVLFYCSTFLACEFAMNTRDSRSQVMDAQGNRRKVDEQGRYVSFKGVTVVADVTKTDIPFFTELYDALAEMPILKNYYALLPVPSYHMTTLNLFTKKDDKSWAKTLTKRKADFKNIATRFATIEVMPEVSPQRITASTTIKLVVNVQSAYADEMHKIGSDFGIESKIPNPLHITLGYLYQDIPNDILESLRKELRKVLAALLRAHHYVDKAFILDQASLRYFNDMTDFPQWDGENDPF